jgi:hypothetical protein
MRTTSTVRAFVAASAFALVCLPFATRSTAQDVAEIRRSAERILNMEQVQLASEERRLDESIQDWTRRFDRYAASGADISKAGAFGDPLDLTLDLNLQAEAVKRVTNELKDAQALRCNQLQEIKDKRRQTDSSAVDLYADEVHAQVACTALFGMYRNSLKQLQVFASIQKLLVLRVKVASGQSKERFAQELSDAKSTLEDLTATLEKDNVNTEKMMNFFLSYN